MAKRNMKTPVVDESASDSNSDQEITTLEVSTKVLVGMKVKLDDGRKATIVKVDKSTGKLIVQPGRVWRKRNRDMTGWEPGMKVILKDGSEGKISSVDHELAIFLVRRMTNGRGLKCSPWNFVKDGKKIVSRDYLENNR